MKDPKRKMGRALSSGDIFAYKRATDMSRKRAADQPVHVTKDSLLSVESGFTNFRGLINWGLIMLLVFGGKMALQNLINNGIIVDPFIWRYILDGEHAHQRGFLIIACTIPSHFYSVPTINDVSAFVLFRVLTGTCDKKLLAYEGLIIPRDFSCPCTILYTVVFLKLWSYAHVNSWCRAAENNSQRNPIKEKKQLLAANHSLLKLKKENDVLGRATRAMSTIKEPVVLKALASNRSGLDHEDTTDGKIVEKPEAERKEEDDVLSDLDEVALNKIVLNITEYPDNLTLYDLYYFMLAPTLCYELNFPRTFTIRKRFLLKRMLELICLVQVMMMLIQQWMAPSLKSSVTPFIRSSWLYTLERLLTIAIPNHIIWLLGFYALFHSFLNVQAELLKFADRSFYEDWW
ncbi:hypothetical protein ACTXT7_015038 [Hymenolepis weldensis]